MRRTLQESGIVIYADKNKFTNCGGAGNCGTCAVTVTGYHAYIIALTTRFFSSFLIHPLLYTYL